jgi:hypothetical protein
MRPDQRISGPALEPGFIGEEVAHITFATAVSALLKVFVYGRQLSVSLRPASTTRSSTLLMSFPLRDFG